MHRAIRWETIESAQNAVLKEIRRAVARGGLTEDGCCVAEGPHLVEEAARSGLRVAAIVASEEAAAEFHGATESGAETRYLKVKASLFREVASTESSQGVLALVKTPEWSETEVFAGNALVLVLDAVQDPGNAGTLVRTAEAFGATGALLLKGTVSAWNPKTLRASAGSLFRLPTLTGLTGEDALALCERRGVQLWLTLARGGLAPGACDLTGPCALVIGSEAHGVSAALRAVTGAISIPTARVESLNAGVAGAIALYEAARQRMEV